jgi:hypothetical protein
MEAIVGESWKFFPCQIEGDAAFVYVDVDALEHIDRAPGTLLRVRLIYKAPRPNGLPTREEFDVAIAIEKRLARFAKRGGDRYVGRVTRSGFREFHVYTRRGKAAWQEFLAKLAKKTGYSFELKITSDKRHAAYKKALYPTPDAWQVITDIDVITLLQREGDMEAVRRRIDHWSYFDTAKAASRFAAWAAKAGYKHDAKLSGVDEQGEHFVRLYHVGTTRQREISGHSITLNRKAADLGGRYDGWETKVVKRSRAIGA